MSGVLYKVEFPDYDDELKYPKRFSDKWRDDSWHNDIMPHISFTTSKNVRYDIWQDYKDESLREYEDTERYIFWILVDEEIIFSRCTDDWEEIEELVDAIVI